MLLRNGQLLHGKLGPDAGLEAPTMVGKVRHVADRVVGLAFDGLRIWARWSDGDLAVRELAGGAWSPFEHGEPAFASILLSPLGGIVELGHGSLRWLDPDLESTRWSISTPTWRDAWPADSGTWLVADDTLAFAARGAAPMTHGLPPGMPRLEGQRTYIEAANGDTYYTVADGLLQTYRYAEGRLSAGTARAVRAEPPLAGVIAASGPRLLTAHAEPRGMPREHLSVWLVEQTPGGQLEAIAPLLDVRRKNYFQFGEGAVWLLGPDGSLRVIDLRRPAEPELLDLAFLFPALINFASAGTIVAAAIGSDLVVLDASRLEDTQVRGSLDLGTAARHLAVSPPWIFLTTRDRQGRGALRLVDTRLPELPDERARVPISGGPDALRARGDRVVLVDLGAVQVYRVAERPATPSPAPRPAATPGPRASPTWSPTATAVPSDPAGILWLPWARLSR